jgi:hypothetical protein
MKANINSAATIKQSALQESVLIQMPGASRGKPQILTISCELDLRINFNNENAALKLEKFGIWTCSSANSWFNARVGVSNQSFALETGAG